jgi:hypothetical protein
MPNKDKTLRSGVIRLAHTNPELRSQLLPLLKKAALPTVPEPGDLSGFDMERCCFCRTPTAKWSDLPDRSPGEQVAVCDKCAAVATPDAVPTKKMWMARERVLHKRGL